MAAIDRGFLAQFRELDPEGGLALADRILSVYLDTCAPTFSEIEAAVASIDDGGGPFDNGGSPSGGDDAGRTKLLEEPPAEPFRWLR